MMETENRRRKWPIRFLLLLFLCLLGLHTLFFVYPNCRVVPLEEETQDKKSSPSLRLFEYRNRVVLDNGLVRVTISTPSGLISKINYKGIRNVLDSDLHESQRGYWDFVWSRPGKDEENFHKVRSTVYKVITQDENQIELSFKNKYDPSFTRNGTVPPLTVDKRFALLRGESGFYSYAIFERSEGWPALHLIQARLTFKLDRNRFNYMAISDDKQRFMPNTKDLRRGQPLAYKEAILLTNPTNQALKGEVDDKYQYSLSNKDNHVHGWVSARERKRGEGWVCYDEHEGFWLMIPSYEFKTGGPLKQELTSHAGPTSLADFHSQHYAGKAFKGLKFEAGEAWKKVFGPVFVYLNRESSSAEPYLLWEDAREQSSIEIKKWPYSFPKSADFPAADQRASISGRLLINDRFLKSGDFPAKSAYVGLAAPGPPGSWQTEAKGYQFWTQTDDKGYFTIKGIRAGNYNLYAWVPGIFGDYKYGLHVYVIAGNVSSLGDLVFMPPRNGPTIWEIGIPDRTAAEFYVPDPPSQFINSLYLNHTEKYRQYGLWDRYTDLYPNQDLIYKVGSSNYQKDWFYAHVTRRNAKNQYVATTWQISFDMEKVIPTANYTVQLALASAFRAEVQVRVNDELRPVPDFSTDLIGTDNAIARHGIHGQYWAFSFVFPGNRLVVGSNTIFLKQARGGYVFFGVMYDYLRLEGPGK